LNEANKSDDPPVWEPKYRATEFFKLNNLTELDKIKSFVMNIEHDEEIFKKAIEAFFAGGPESISRQKDKKIARYLRCRYIENTFNDFFDCIKWHTWNGEDYAFKAVNIITGKWYMRLPDRL
jgi:hypothetical protein